MDTKLDMNILIDLSETLAQDMGITASFCLHDKKTKPSDFRILKNLAKGGYGEVYVAEKNGKIYAMKKVSKHAIMKNFNTTFFMNEREIMTSHTIDWLVKSHMCVQDKSHLYYIMDFIHGGDLMGYLSRKDVMGEDEIRFYAAEIFTAVNEMHKMGWVHRDLKPDNILIDKHGHIKLADFGSCIKMRNGVVQSNITVGTPDYISPDVLSSIGETVVYGTEVDYWTVGVILFEMFYGTTPFYSESLKETYSKINSIDFSFHGGISDDLRDLISHLLCERTKRYQFNDIIQHRFFSTTNWNALRQTKPPFVPELLDDIDISNFVDTEFEPDIAIHDCGFQKFIGFTYDPECCNSIVDTMFSDRFTKDPCNTVSRALECSKRELDDIKETINMHMAEKNRIETMLGDCNANLQNTIEQIAYKKEILNGIQNDISTAHLELLQIKSDAMEAKKEDSCTNADMVRDIGRMIHKARIPERMDAIQQDAYWFYKQNVYLINEINLMNEKDADNKTTEDLKKQLRAQKNEIREYEQKIDQEIILRKRLESEIRSLKRCLRDANRLSGCLVLPCINAMSNQNAEIRIEDNVLRIGSHEAALENIYVRDLKNNEMHHLPYKKRALCVQIHFLTGMARCSSESGSRRSLKALEIDLDRETRILKGLEDLLKVLDGRTKDEAEMQKKGSVKKIEQLREEIERSRRSSVSDAVIGDNEKVYEFNNHLFYERTVAKGTLCDHCNEVLYGVVNQAFCCKDCLLVVHKSCYVLVEISCELNRSIMTGTSVPVICRTSEDKERLLQLNKGL